MWHLLGLPFVFLGFLMFGVMALAGVAMFSVFLIPLILLGVFLRIGFALFKVALIGVFGIVLLACCV